MRRLMTILIAAIMIGCSSGNEQKKSNDEAVENQEVTEATVEKKGVKAKRYSEIPDFTKYTDVKEKKKAFFDFLRPMVKEENNRIRAERSKLITLFDEYESSNTLKPADAEWIDGLAETMRMKTFDITNEEDKQTLLRRVDIVPPSLFLAQAANESSWGTSRFARQANNIFGQWCFTPGCGIVPSQRGKDETHEVQKFNTVNAAVNSYVRNINSHNAYSGLRFVREEMRNDGEKPDGISLAGGLLKYSARGEEYVKEIREMIDYNDLE